MKITIQWITNIKIKEVEDKIKKASRQGLVDVVRDIAQDVKEHAPPPPKWGTGMSTGHNRRSIQFEVGPNKPIAQKELEGAVYSTSGYGGYLETGTSKMNPRPYFKPALDRHSRYLDDRIKAHLE